jgi:hypothetical protein
MIDVPPLFKVMPEINGENQQIFSENRGKFERSRNRAIASYWKNYSASRGQTQDNQPVK